MDGIFHGVVTHPLRKRRRCVLRWRKGTDKGHRRGCMREYVGLMTHLMDATHGRWEGCRHGNVATRQLLFFRRLQHHMNNPDSLISLLCWDDGDLGRVKYMDCSLISFFFFALSYFYFLLQPMIQSSKVPSFSFCLPVYQIWMFAPVCACVVLIEPVQNKPSAGIRPGDTSGTHLCQMCVNCCFPICPLSGCVTPFLFCFFLCCFL